MAKKAVLVFLECSASKDLLRELSRYLSGYLAENKMTGDIRRLNISTSYRVRVGGAVAPWLVSSTPDRVVRVRALAIFLAIFLVA